MAVAGKKERVGKLEVSEIAKICHEANKAYCELLGDFSQVEWARAPTNIRACAMDGVRFHFDNPKANCAASHVNWYTFKASQGWKYGPVKDFDKKEHPCMVPYLELPLEQRRKDALFKAIVDGLESMGE